MADQQSRLAIIVGVEGVERAAADLERFERAVQQAKQKSTAGPASSTLAGATNPSQADQGLAQVFKNNTNALAAYERGLDNASGKLSESGKRVISAVSQYELLSAKLSEARRGIVALSESASTLRIADVAPRPSSATGPLNVETNYLRSLGLEGSIGRVEGGFAPFSARGTQLAPATSTRQAAAERLYEAELTRLVQKGELLGAEMAGLATGYRYIKEQQQAAALQAGRRADADKQLNQEVQDRRDAERKARLAAEAFARRQAQIDALPSGATGGSPYRMLAPEGMVQRPRYNDEGVMVGSFSDFGPVDDRGLPTTDAGFAIMRADELRAENKTKSAMISDEVRRIEADALNRLKETYKGQGGEIGRTPGQISQAYAQALESARPALEANKAFNDVAPALERQAKAATAGAVVQERMNEHSAALLERERARASTMGLFGQGPLGQQVGGFAADFQQGFRGRRDLPYGEQLGQVAKFSLLYGAAYSALFQLSQGLQLAITNAIDFNAAVIELSISSGRTTDAVGGLAESLGDISSAYGFAPSEGVLAGSRAIGIFGLNDAPSAQQDFYARAFTEATAQLAFVTNRTFEQVGQDLGAITQGFGLDASSVGYVQDLDAYFAKQFGSLPGGTLETTAQIGSLGAEAGFSLEEVSALASLLQSRTGQTPAATAGFLSQFFGRAGDPALRQKFAELGIDISVPFRDQIDQLSELLQSNELGEGLRLEIINAFGRGRSGQAAAIISQEFGTVEEKALTAKTAAPGAGQQQFEERLNAIGGQLKQLGGATLELLKNIGESGLLDAFGALILVTKEVVDAANTIVEAFNLLPREIRDIIIAIAAWKLAMGTDVGRAAIASALSTTTRGTSIAENLGLVPGRATTGTGAPIPVSPGQLSLFPVGGAAPPRVPTTRFGAVSQRLGLSALPQALGLPAARAAAAAGAVASLALLSNPVTLAIGGLLAIGAIKGQMENLNAALDDATASLATGNTSDPEALRQNAASLREQAGVTEDADGFWANLIGAGDLWGFNTRKPSEAAAQQRARAAQLERQAEEIEAFYERTSSAMSSSIFGVSTTNIDNVATGLSELAAAGATPVQQFNLLTKAIKESGAAANQTAEDFSLLPGEIERALQGATGDVSKENLFFEYNPDLSEEENERRRQAAIASQGGIFGTDLFRDEIDYFKQGDTTGLFPAPLQAPYEDADLQQLLQDRFDSAGIEENIRALIEGNGGKPPIQAIKDYIEGVIRGTDFSNVGGFALTDEQQAALADVLAPVYAEAIAAPLETFDPSEVYNSNTFTQQLETNLRPTFEAKLAQLQTEGYGEGSSRYDDTIRRYLSTLRATKFEGGVKPGKYFAEIRALEAQLASSTIARLEGAREVAQASAQTDKEFREIGRRYLRRELRTAIQSRSIDLIKAVISRSSDSVVRNVRGAIVADLEAARAAYKAALRAIEWVQRGSHLMVAADKAAARALEVAAAQIRKLQKQLDALDESRKIVVPEATALTPPDDLEPDDEDTGPTQAQIDAARAIAEAARRGGAISQATAELQSARADLAAAEEGTVEYYQALAGVYEAQRSLAEAIRDDRINQFLLSNDITDPVVQAQAELKRARQQLRYDQRNNASPELIREDRLAVREAEASKRAAAFQQWFSDLQTAENLERISNAAYIRHLERRRERLAAIKNRTRQEQEQLDQIDAALKAAKESMSGQFNIGDIRVPTPYEVRRYIEQTKANAVGAANQAGAGAEAGPGRPGTEQLTNINNNITIDGADIPMIRRILRDILGDQAIKSTATKTGKR